MDFEGEEGALNCSSHLHKTFQDPQQNSANPSVCIVKKDRLVGFVYIVQNRKLSYEQHGAPQNHQSTPTINPLSTEQLDCPLTGEEN